MRVSDTENKFNTWKLFVCRKEQLRAKNNYDNFQGHSIGPTWKILFLQKLPFPLLCSVYVLSFISGMAPLWKIFAILYICSTKHVYNLRVFGHLQSLSQQQHPMQGLRLTALMISQYHCLSQSCHQWRGSHKAWIWTWPLLQRIRVALLSRTNSFL